MQHLTVSMFMTYDLSGTWNPYTWYNSALYDQDGLVSSLNQLRRSF